VRGDLSEDDLVTIGEMIEKRFVAKLKRNFDVADEIRATLHGTYNIYLLMIRIENDRGCVMTMCRN